MTALLLTYSRSSYLGFLAAIGTWIVIRKKWKVGLVGLLLFLVAIVYLPRSGEALSLDRFDSTVSRLANWSESVQRIAQKPILGYGFNVLPFLQQESSVSSKAGAGIDNSFLFVGVTTGLVGLIAYGWLLWSMIGVGKRALRAKKTSILGTAYLATLIALVVDSMFVNSLFYPWVMVWVWILTGAVEGISDPSRN
jgi:O-antigen ligase